MVEDPTIIPAALCPGPATLLAELFEPPKVPRSVRPKLNCASARVNAKSSRNKNAAPVILFLVFMVRNDDERRRAFYRAIRACARKKRSRRANTPAPALW